MCSTHKQTNGHLNGQFYDTETKYTYESVKVIADFIMKRTHIRPKIGIICGSGLGSIPEELTDTTEIKYEDIPNFPKSTVHGHAGKLVFGLMSGVQVMCMQGRIHYYEGYHLSTCTMPVRMMKLCGVSHIIISNAAGGLNPEFSCGDIMLMKDHVNFLGFGGANPLIGPNDERWGPRFVPMNRAYSLEIRKQAKLAAKEVGIESIIREGVYAIVGGPNYETVAECRLLHQLGIDAVGMSTVAETITAHQAGMVVFGFSLITNKGIMDYDTPEEPSHAEVLELAQKREIQIRKWLARLIAMIAPNLPAR